MPSRTSSQYCAASGLAWGAFLGRVVTAFMKMGIGLVMALWIIGALWLH